MFGVRELAGTIDLWGCMWEEEERERFETAVVLSMTAIHPLRGRTLGFATALLIGTPRLLAAAEHFAKTRLLSNEEIAWIRRRIAPLAQLCISAKRLRGDMEALEALVMRHVVDPTCAELDELLDLVDVRDLVALAQTTADRRLKAEAKRRIGQRGRYQRARVESVLRFYSMETALGVG
jgi:hypothetical protein